MAGKNNNWDSHIDAAMQELDSKTQVSRNRFVFILPGWFPWLLVAILGVSLYLNLGSADRPHQPGDRNYNVGGKVALLMVAEDIEKYRQEHGELPQQLESLLGSVLQVRYTRKSESSYELRMASAAGELVFGEDDLKYFINTR